MARWRTLVAAAGAVLALALTSGAGYRPETSLPRWQSAAGAVELSVTLVGGDDEIVVGRSVTYAIEARNSGRRPVTTSLRASVPARMYEVVPADGGRLAQGVVEWPEVAIPAGRTVTLHVTGAYGPADSDEPRSARVAFTVCALDPDDGEPVVCATAVARTTAGGARWPYRIALVVAAGAIAAAMVWRRRHPTGATASWFRRDGRSALRSPRAEPSRSPGREPTPAQEQGTGPAPGHPPGGSPPPPPPARPVTG